MGDIAISREANLFAMTKKIFLTAIVLLSVLTTGAWQSQNRSGAEPSVKASESFLLQTGTFGKTAPANGATNVNPVSLVLSWQAYSPSPVAYSYCVKEGSACASNDPNWTRVGLNTSVTLTLAYNKTYYWQVRAIVCDTCLPKVFVYADNGTVFTFQTRPIQVTIVGNAGVAGAVLSYTDGVPRTVTSNATGAYSITLPFNWTGTITPSKTGYLFTPRSASFTNLTASQTIQNFTAVVAYSISGNVGLPGLTLSYVIDTTTHTVTADGSGNYSFIVPSGWNGTVTPSPVCYTFTPPNRVYTNVTANQTAQNYTPTFNPSSGCADIDVLIAGNNVGGYIVAPDTGIRVGFGGVDNGPAKIVSMNNVDILAALRVIWREPGPRFSYSEMMGLPVEQLSSEYWFPWYNNLDTASMDQGFRIANVSTTENNTVEVRLGSTVLDTIQLGMGASVRVAYDVDNGPIRIVCTTCTNTGADKIIAALRVIWKEPGFRASYSEMMGLPVEQLSSEYWFPWYNNASIASMDQGFRIANVDLASSNTVEVRVGNTLLETITLDAGGSTRVGYTIDNGPVNILCTTCPNTGDDKIIAALRVIWKEPGYRSSYSEMMGLPVEQLSTEYWFPWYNNAAPNILDQGFRIANVDSSQHTIQVWVGATKLTNPDITLAGGASTRVAYNVDNGPIRVVCTDCSDPDDKIIVALRVIWKEAGARSSYSEMMGLPNEALSTEYWFPWYNFAAPGSMDQGFRIAVP